MNMLAFQAAPSYRADPMKSYEQGMDLRAKMDKRDQRNALADLRKQHGAGLVSGDQNSINALAGLDPAAAAEYQDRANSSRAAERKANIEKAGMVAGAVYSADTPEKFDLATRTLAQAGIIPESDLGKYTFEGRDALVAQVQGVEGQIKQEQDIRDYQEGARRFNAEFSQAQSHFNQQMGLSKNRLSLDRDALNHRIAESRSKEEAQRAEAEAAANGPKKLTEGQSKLTLFKSIQGESSPVLEQLESQFAPNNLNDVAARSMPIAGAWFKSEQGRLYDATARAWSEAALRIQTGAAATSEEVDRVMNTYFASLGDSPTVIAHKRNLRSTFGRGIEAALGGELGKGLSLPSQEGDSALLDVGQSREINGVTIQRIE